MNSKLLIAVNVRGTFYFGMMKCMGRKKGHLLDFASRISFNFDYFQSKTMLKLCNSSPFVLLFWGFTGKAASVNF